MNKKTTFLLIGFGRVFQVAITFLTLKIVTNLLPPKEVAYYFLILSILNYFGLAFISPAGQYVNRYTHKWHNEKNLLNRFFTHHLYIAAVSFLSIPVILLATKYFGVLSGVSPFQLTLLITLGIFFNTTIATFVPTFNMLNFRILFVVFTCLWLSASLGLSLLFMSHWGKSIIPWFWGQIVAQILFTFLAMFSLAKLIKNPFDFKAAISVITTQNIKEALRFCAPLVLSTFLLWATTDSFRFVFEKTLGLEYLALVSVGFAISQRISYAVESIAQQVFFPNYYSEINSESKGHREKAWQTLFYSSIPLYILTLAFTIICAPLLISIFSGPNYKSAVSFVILGAIFNFFRKLSSTLSLIAHSEQQTKLLILPYLVGAFFSSFGVYLASLVNKHLPIIIMTLGSSAMFFLMLKQMNKIQKIQWSYIDFTKTIKNISKN